MGHLITLESARVVVQAFLRTSADAAHHLPLLYDESARPNHGMRRTARLILDPAHLTADGRVKTTWGEVVMKEGGVIDLKAVALLATAFNDRAVYGAERETEDGGTEECENCNWPPKVLSGCTRLHAIVGGGEPDCVNCRFKGEECRPLR